MIYNAIKGRASYGMGVGIIPTDFYMPFPPATLGNTSSFPFPVTFSVVSGATLEQMKSAFDPELVQKFTDAGWDLVKQGVKGITGNCGFMVYYQDFLAKEALAKCGNPVP